MDGPRARLSACGLSWRACKNLQGDRGHVHSAPYGPVRSRRRDLQATWEFFSRCPTEFLVAFPRSTLARVSLRPVSAKRRGDVTRGDAVSSSVLTLQLGLPWDSFAAQRKRYFRGDEEPFAWARSRCVFARPPTTSFGQRWINCRTVSCRMLCSART